MPANDVSCKRHSKANLSLGVQVLVPMAWQACKTRAERDFCGSSVLHMRKHVAVRWSSEVRELLRQQYEQMRQSVVEAMDEAALCTSPSGLQALESL